MSTIIHVWVVSRANTVLRIIYMISIRYINITSSTVNTTHAGGVEEEKKKTRDIKLFCKILL